jgi:V8-like Glu-specific endopeptidase
MIRALFTLLLTLTLVAPHAQGVNYPQPTGATKARTFPFSMIGQLLFQNAGYGYSGTGTVVGVYGVLTAGHNLYDRYGGKSVDVRFNRGHYGSSNLSSQRASRTYIFGGYQTNAQRYGGNNYRSFATDLGGVTFVTPVASGAHAGWTTDRSLLTGGYYKDVLGYGGQYPHNGERLLSVLPTRGFYQIHNAFYENNSIYIEQGMSGGPVFARTSGGLSVVAVVVSGSQRPPAGGVRVLNGAAADFIDTYLR